MSHVMEIENLPGFSSDLLTYINTVSDQDSR